MLIFWIDLFKYFPFLKELFKILFQKLIYYIVYLLISYGLDCSFLSLFILDSSEEAEALVDSLTIENTTLNEENLQGLSTTDFQTLTELSHELTLNNNETDETEGIIQQNHWCHLISQCNFR